MKKIEKFPKFSKDFDFFTIDLEKFGMDLEKSRFGGQNAQVFTCAKVATKAPRHKEGRFGVKFSHRGHSKYILSHREHRDHPEDNLSSYLSEIAAHLTG